MASIALDPAYRRVSVEEFLDMDFGGAKAELEDGIIFMMAGGNEVHSRIASNIIIALGTRLRGTGCRPYGSDFATRTDIASVRFPDVSVYCNRPGTPENARKKLLNDPQVVFEVLSPSTKSHDLRVKAAEFRELAGVQEIVFVDPETHRVRLMRRTSPEGWTDEMLQPGQDVPLPSLGVTLPHAEIFDGD